MYAVARKGRAKKRVQTSFKTTTTLAMLFCTFVNRSQLLQDVPMGMLTEFKEFAVKGNVIDLAVGVVIGAAFGAIVTSLVSDIIMPPIGILVGGLDFSDISTVLKEASADGKTPAVAIRWGVFLNAIIKFIIVAFSIFMVVKVINAAKKKEAAAPSVPAEPTNEEKLLTEIRDLLKK